MRAARALVHGALLAAVAAGGWAVSRAAATLARPAPDTTGPTLAQYREATLPVRGPAGHAASASLHAAAPPPVLVVVLRGADLRTCEDLGRQLRELRASFPSLPLLAVTEPTALPEVRRFLRRERIPVDVVPVDPEAIVVGYPELATPAVLWWEDGHMEGISHPRRFQNVRVRSFAAELRELR